jgi:hypothetical protein
MQTHPFPCFPPQTADHRLTDPPFDLSVSADLFAESEIRIRGTWELVFWWRTRVFLWRTK